MCNSESDLWREGYTITPVTPIPLIIKKVLLSDCFSLIEAATANDKYESK